MAVVLVIGGGGRAAFLHVFLEGLVSLTLHCLAGRSLGSGLLSTSWSILQIIAEPLLVAYIVVKLISRFGDTTVSSIVDATEQEAGTDRCAPRLWSERI